MVRVFIPDDKTNKTGNRFNVTMKAGGPKTSGKDGRTFDLVTSSREESNVNDLNILLHPPKCHCSLVYSMYMMDGLVIEMG
jgi:hypothetical protein